MAYNLEAIWIGSTIFLNTYTAIRAVFMCIEKQLRSLRVTAFEKIHLHYIPLIKLQNTMQNKYILFFFVCYFKLYKNITIFFCILLSKICKMLCRCLHRDCNELKVQYVLFSE